MSLGTGLGQKHPAYPWAAVPKDYCEQQEKNDARKEEADFKLFLRDENRCCTRGRVSKL
ncbi:MAG: hypothetical protein WBE74_17390 [Terracidiphilus sp.]